MHCQVLEGMRLGGLFGFPSLGREWGGDGAGGFFSPDSELPGAGQSLGGDRVRRWLFGGGGGQTPSAEWPRGTWGGGSGEEKGGERLDTFEERYNNRYKRGNQV